MASLSELLLQNTNVGAPTQNAWAGNQFQIAPGAGGLAALLGGGGQGQQQQQSGGGLSSALSQIQGMNQPYEDYFAERTDLRGAWDNFSSNRRDQQYMADQGYDLTPAGWLQFHHENNDGITLPGTDYRRAANVLFDGQAPGPLNQPEQQGGGGLPDWLTMGLGGIGGALSRL